MAATRPLKSGVACPLCGADVPAEIIALHGSFDCPCCRKPLKISGLYELIVKLTAVVIGFLLARGADLGVVWWFFLGVLLSLLLIAPIWKVFTALKRPSLIESIPSGPLRLF